MRKRPYKVNPCPHCGQPLTIEEAGKIAKLWYAQSGGMSSCIPKGWCGIMEAAETLGVRYDQLRDAMESGLVRNYRVFRNKSGKRVVGFRKKDLGIE